MTTTAPSHLSKSNNLNSAWISTCWQLSFYNFHLVLCFPLMTHKCDERWIAMQSDHYHSRPVQRRQSCCREYPTRPRCSPRTQRWWAISRFSHTFPASWSGLGGVGTLTWGLMGKTVIVEGKRIFCWWETNCPYSIKAVYLHVLTILLFFSPHSITHASTYIYGRLSNR